MLGFKFRTLGYLQKINKAINERYIFYRRFAVVEYNIENHKNDNKFNQEKSKIFVRRIKTIDKNLEEKISDALSRMDFNPPFDISEAKKRLEKGYYFVIAEQNDEIIGWRWAAINSIFISEIGKRVKLEKREAYDFNAYVEKLYRSKGINKIMIRHEVSCLHNARFRKMWGLNYSWNIAHLKSLTRMGYKIVAYYYYFKFFFIKIGYRSQLKQNV